ncbi:hypothetical protein ACKAV7_001932 [Fusarium commune]
MTAFTSSPSTKWIHEPVDVAIVGGGLSGLAAAKDLVAAGKSVLVLEARDRVGGKVYDVEVKDGNSYKVEAGAEFILNKVIIAIPPTLAGRIIYHPPLPAARDQLCQRVPMGSIGKAIAIYKTPFWRDQGLSGEVASLEGVSQSTFNSSPPDGSFGAIIGFL